MKRSRRAGGTTRDAETRLEAAQGSDPDSQAGVELPELAPTESIGLTETGRHQVQNPKGSLGPYRLVKCLGEGGMGSVWEAEQVEPVRRKVALKLIKAGLVSGDLLARFEAERQVLAVMDHPNVAKILDAGTTAAGQPWFAMELVQGLTLSRFCDRQRLTIRDRLQVFLQVCAGVQHAHQKGIVHRDLKPGNIIVAAVDGKPVPKVIDFGLAKVLQSAEPVTAEPSQTGIGVVLGTLKYMSPEQARLDTRDIDTRTDIFSLGVILHELLIGRTPLDEASIRADDPLAVLQRIRDFDAARPSDVLRRLTPEACRALVERRQTEARWLAQELARELDWIVLKSLENDRNGRYDTVAGLQRDVAHYLADEPVEARPQSALYRYRKFARKNRILVVASALVALTFLAGLAGTTWGLFSARTAWRSESRRANAERLANLTAQQRLGQIEKGNQVLAGIFRDLDIVQSRLGDEPLEAMLASRLVKAGEQIDAELVGDPLVTASLKHQLGESLVSLGFPAPAEELFRKAYLTRVERLGNDHPDSLSSESGIAEAECLQGEPQNAVPALERVLAVRRASLARNDPLVLQSLNNLANGLRATGTLDRAIEMFEVALALSREIHGDSDYRTITSLNNLALARQAKGELSETINLLKKALETAELHLGPVHPVTLGSMNNLAIAYRETGELKQAGDLLEKCLATLTEKRGDFHIDTLRSASNLAEFLCFVGQRERGLAIFDVTWNRLNSRSGPGNPDTRSCLGNYAHAAFAGGDVVRAAELYQALHEELFRDSDRVETEEQLLCVQGLASSQWGCGQLALAEPHYERCLVVQEKRLGRGHFEVLSTIASLGVIKRELGKANEAVILLREVVAAASRFPQLRAFRQELRSACVKAGQFEEARTMLEEDLPAARRQFAREPVELAAALHAIGLDQVGIGDYGPAESVLRTSYDIRLERIPDDWRTFNTASLLGEAMLGRVMMNDANLDETSMPQRDEQLANAEKLLEAGYRGLATRSEKIPLVSRRDRLVQAIDRLIRFAELSNDTDQLQKWQALKAELQSN